MACWASPFSPVHCLEVTEHNKYFEQSFGYYNLDFAIMNNEEGYDTKNCISSVFPVYFQCISSVFLVYHSGSNGCQSLEGASRSLQPLSQAIRSLTTNWWFFLQFLIELYKYINVHPLSQVIKSLTTNILLFLIFIFLLHFNGVVQLQVGYN